MLRAASKPHVTVEPAGQLPIAKRAAYCYMLKLLGKLQVEQGAGNNSRLKSILQLIAHLQTQLASQRIPTSPSCSCSADTCLLVQDIKLARLDTA